MQSPEWHAAHKRENALYRRCHADPLKANWPEYFKAMRAADALYSIPQGEQRRA